MDNRTGKVTTIKDIATDLGVSMTTVHKAIYNKKGISEENRQRILQYIESQNFRINRSASALKRKAIRLAYVGLEPSESNAFYFQKLKNCIEEAYEGYRSLNVDMEFYTTSEAPEDQITLLQKLYNEELGNLDGLLVASAHDTLISPMVRKFVEAGIKVVTINGDAHNSNRHAYVTDDSIMAGHVAADLLVNLGIPKQGYVLLVCGYRDFSNHRLFSSSFADWLSRERPDVDVVDMYQQGDLKSTTDKIIRYLSTFPDIRAVCCANARTTYAACCAIQKLKMSNSIKLVGSDVYEELRTFFQDGTINATIFKDPKKQSSIAMDCLYNLVTQEKAVDPHQFVGVGIVLKSNFNSFL